MNARRSCPFLLLATPSAVEIDDGEFHAEMKALLGVC